MTNSDSIKVQQIWLGAKIGISDTILLEIVDGNKSTLEAIKQLDDVILEEDALFNAYRYDTSDGTYRTLLEEQKFWQSFQDLLPVFEKSSVTLNYDFFSKKVNGDNSVIDYSYASQIKGAVFNPTLWQGREAEMMSVFYLLPRPKRNAINITAVRKEIHTRAGQIYRPEILDMALKQRTSSMVEIVDKGLVKLYADIIEMIGIKPDIQDIIVPLDDDGISNFHKVSHFHDFKRWVLFFREHGQEFAIEDLVRKYGDSNSFIQEAADTNLDAVFHKDIWAGRLDEMLELWSHVPQDARDTKDVDINALYEEAEDATFANITITIDNNTTKEDLFMPVTLDGCNQSVCLMGTKAAWDNIDTIMDLMDQKGTPITLEDLYQTTGYTDETLISKAVKFGYYGHVLSLIDPENNIYLSFEKASQKSLAGHSFLNNIERDFKIKELFHESLWAGNAKLMLEFWNAFETSHAKEAVSEAEFCEKLSHANIQTLRRVHQTLKKRPKKTLTP